MSVKALFGRIEIEFFLVFSVFCWGFQSRLPTGVEEEILARHWGAEKSLCSGRDVQQAAEVGRSPDRSTGYGLVSVLCLFW